MLVIVALFALQLLRMGIGVAAAECIHKLDFIRAFEHYRDESEFRTYILCPNTEFTLADKIESGLAVSQGESPLILSKSNVRIQCGDDGSSENNCVLRGGSFQLGFMRSIDDGSSSQWFHKPISNVVIRGVTFMGATEHNVLARNEGSLTLVDCVVRCYSIWRSRALTKSHSSLTTRMLRPSMRCCQTRISTGVSVASAICS